MTVEPSIRMEESYIWISEAHRQECLCHLSAATYKALPSRGFEALFDTKRTV